MDAAVGYFISGDGARARINANLMQNHYLRFEVTYSFDNSHVSPPLAATMARRANALASVAELAFPIEVQTMTTAVWMEQVGKRQAELHSTLSKVGQRDRFLNRSRIPNSVWVEMAGRAAMLIQTFGITSRDITDALTEYRLQIRHAAAARTALIDLACPMGPAAMGAMRARLIKAWIAKHSARKRANGELKPVSSRDQLRKDIVSWNKQKHLVKGKPGYLSTNGSHDELLRKLAEAAVCGQLIPWLCRVRVRV